MPQQARDHGELLTYVSEGALAYHDSMGRVCVVQTGEFQCATTQPANRQSAANPSCSESAHIFQIWLASPTKALQPELEQRRFGRADRRGRLCIVASPDARSSSLRVRRNVSLYCGLLASGQHIVHELAPGRCAWLHIIRGEVALGDLILSTGDGAGLIAERALSLTVRSQTEVLLIDGENPTARRDHDQNC
jgi:redox-sensitive bicupin YhaK (pirin superfamily)